MLQLFSNLELCRGRPPVAARHLKYTQELRASIARAATGGRPLQSSVSSARSYLNFAE